MTVESWGYIGESPIVIISLSPHFVLHTHDLGKSESYLMCMKGNYLIGINIGKY